MRKPWPSLEIPKAPAAALRVLGSHEMISLVGLKTRFWVGGSRAPGDGGRMSGTWQVPLPGLARILNLEVEPNFPEASGFSLSLWFAKNLIWHSRAAVSSGPNGDQTWNGLIFEV